MLNSDALHQLKQLKKDIKASRNLATGRVKGSNSKFGFVTLNDTGKDIYLSADEMQKVFPGDEVEIEILTNEKNKDYGVIERLIQSELSTFIGRVRKKNKNSFAEPDVPGLQRWLFIHPGKLQNAQEGDFVRCKILQHPIRNGKPQVAVLDVVGAEKQVGIEKLYTISKHEVRDNWSQAILDECAQITDEVILREGANREDLTQLPFLTIDSAATQDMDDALYATATDTGWSLSVAIADPTAFIAPESAIEKEAALRGSSVYYPGSVISMLPEHIANQLSSLVPDQNRLALVCKLEITAQGDVDSFNITQAVVQSHGKLSYESVAQYIDNGDETGIQALLNDPAHLPALTTSLQYLKAISSALNQWRFSHALINDDRTDFRLKLNEQQKIEQIVRLEQTSAHKIVEECMIAANRCAARYLLDNPGSQEAPGLFVAHTGIRQDKQSAIEQIIAEKVAPASPEVSQIGFSTLEDFITLLQLAERTPSEIPLRPLITRQLERSQLSPGAAPHFGMGLPHYTTFTSPIRKYNDFVVHRMIKAHLNGKDAITVTPEQATNIQQAQQKARMAVNEMEQWLKCQYIKSLPADEVYDATITRCTSAGFQAKLDENGIDGFVSTKEMAGKYSFDAVYQTLKGPELTFVPEQKVRVKLDKVDQKRKQINFQIEV
ncbi:exoribonuclease II [Oleiphilus messinensis]|uniref:exoribonuclease II n=1 Tax=Oleiphilus messinensis TaxID=141451 RepID=A0A1Y0I342_9GAMM|nr:VacB/RNase II family 3'-5' exoribonuclease [Oleiphilus messinensis]ARU54680.1 exoribonuclease II [Oleiphilus messinensis]